MPQASRFRRSTGSRHRGQPREDLDSVRPWHRVRHRCPTARDLRHERHTSGNHRVHPNPDEDDGMLAPALPLETRTANRAAGGRPPLREVTRLTPRHGGLLMAPPVFEGMVGRSEAMTELFDFLERLAPYPTTAL